MFGGVIKEAGPPGKDWKFDVLDSKEDAKFRHVLVQVEIPKFRLTGSGRKMFTMSLWSAWDKHHPEADRLAMEKGVRNILVLFNQAPREAAKLGVDRILKEVGPAGYSWGLEVLDTNHSTGHVQVDVWVYENAVTFRGDADYNTGINRKGEAPTIDEEEDDRKKTRPKKPVILESKSWGYHDPSDPDWEVKATGNAAANALRFCGFEIPAASAEASSYEQTSFASNTNTNAHSNDNAPQNPLGFLTSFFSRRSRDVAGGAA